jgi:hypothetical protein
MSSPDKPEIPRRLLLRPSQLIFYCNNA